MSSDDRTLRLHVSIPIRRVIPTNATLAEIFAVDDIAVTVVPEDEEPRTPDNELVGVPGSC